MVRHIQQILHPKPNFSQSIEMKKHVRLLTVRIVPLSGRRRPPGINNEVLTRVEDKQLSWKSTLICNLFS